MQQVCGDKGEAAGRVALAGLGEDVLGGNGQAGVEDRLAEVFAGGDEEARGGDERQELLDRVFQQRPVFMHQLEKLLRPIPARQRPEALAGAAGHDDANPIGLGAIHASIHLARLAEVASVHVRGDGERLQSDDVALHGQ